ncbi:MAG: hypothetical protein ACFE9Q_17780 [Candidatus Hodarchaeota archaeon]
MKSFKKIFCLFIIFISFHIIFDKLINNSYVKSSKIDNYLIIRNSNINASRIEILTYDDEVIWGNNITFSVNFTYTENNGTTWAPVLDPNAYCNITIRLGNKDLFKSNMTPFGNGVFFKEINSSKLSTDIIYIVIFTGFCPKFPDPKPVAIAIIINTVPTRISAHDYSTLEELPEKTYTAYYNEIINITIKYCINESGTPLNKANVTYQRLGLAPIDIFVDPVNNGFYTFTINTSDTQIARSYNISITATYENYTTQSDFTVVLIILERKTTINGQSDLLYLDSKVLVQEKRLFVFIYQDAHNGKIISNLSKATYIWQGLDTMGNPIPGRNGSGYLIQNINKTYTLDFKTELKPIGDYNLLVTLNKSNFEMRLALIILEIKPKPTLLNGTTLTLTIFKDIEFMTSYNFTFEINNALTHSRIGDLDHAFYYWYRTDSNGTILEGPSQIIDLIKDLNDLYILDFNTKLKSIGFYRIHIEFDKENYSSRYAIINLIIHPPPENPSPKIFGYDLMFLLTAIIIITLAIKKKAFDQGLNK